MDKLTKLLEKFEHNKNCSKREENKIFEKMEQDKAKAQKFRESNSYDGDLDKLTEEERLSCVRKARSDIALLSWWQPGKKYFKEVYQGFVNIRNQYYDDLINAKENK